MFTILLIVLRWLQYFSHNRHYWLVKFKHLQGPLKLNSKTFKQQIRFQGLFRALKNGNFFKNFQGKVATLNQFHQMIKRLDDPDETPWAAATYHQQWLHHYNLKITANSLNSCWHCKTHQPQNSTLTCSLRRWIKNCFRLNEILIIFDLQRKINSLSNNAYLQQ